MIALISLSFVKPCSNQQENFNSWASQSIQYNSRTLSGWGCGGDEMFTLKFDNCSTIVGAADTLVRVYDNLGEWGWWGQKGN